MASDAPLLSPAAWPRARLAAWVGLPALGLLLAIAVHPGEPDAALFVQLNAWGRLLPDALWSLLTNLGQTVVLFSLMSTLLLWRARWALAALWSIPFGALFSYGAKALFDAPRPGAVLAAEQFHLIGHLLTSHSFPSGHAITAFAAAGAILGARTLQAPRWPIAALLGLAAMVGASRIAVGAHWPLDVLAGACGGWLCGVAGCWVAASRHPQAPSLRLRRILALVLAAIGLSLWRLDSGYPLAWPLQYLASLVALATALRLCLLRR